MRKDKFMRGGRHRGRGNNRHRGYGGSGRRGGGRYRHGRQRHSRGSSNGGNERERIAIESGALVFIDQFMLANPQFLERLEKILDEDPEAKNELVKDYGGTVVKVGTGTYRIERDPFEYYIIIHADGEPLEGDTLKEATEQKGRVFIDTRCLAMIDRELLDDRDLLVKYQQLWMSGQDKACRDLLRDNGGAVRYGFQKYGDELGIYVVPGQDIVCLWPDVVEPQVAA